MLIGPVAAHDGLYPIPLGALDYQLMPLRHSSNVVVVDLEFLGIVLVGGDDHGRTLVAVGLMVLILRLSE